MLTWDKIQGCYWGLALGDALGQPVEFSQVEVIRQKYGPAGIQEPKAWALWTDDTEMTFAVTQALLRLGPVNTIQKLGNDIVGRTFAEEYIKWFDNPGHSPGLTCMNAVNYLRAHGAETWREAGRNDSKGCGTIMRAAPIGVWFADAIAPELPLRSGPIHDEIVRISEIQSEITHGHKAATAAALAGAYAVALAINGIQPINMIDAIKHICNRIHSDFAAAMERLERALQQRLNGTWNCDVDALHEIGLGWVGEEALAMSLYSAIQSPNDLKGSLCIAVNHNGDSDSVGCIAGSIVGALLGIQSIPLDWVNRIAEKNRMEQILSQLNDFFFLNI